MKVTALKTFPGTAAQSMRGTDAQDTAVDASTWTRRRYIMAAAIGMATLLAIATFAWSLRSWSMSDHLVSRERMRIAPVVQGRFVRDAAAQGTVVAADSPTLFAVAAGTVNYKVRAGDSVTKQMLLATLDSPALRNEYERERASLEGLEAGLARQEIEIRRQILSSQQRADLAQIVIQAAEREYQRAQWAWGQKALSERDIRKAEDDVRSAKLNYEHARSTAELERESLMLDLRTRTAERDRQALVVASLRTRVEELDVRSPVDGMVSNLAQAQRTKVAESTALLTVVDLTAFEIEVQISESYARDIKSGMVAEITLDGRKHAGTVTAISPEVKQNQVVGRVQFAQPQPPGLRQNQRASVRIVLDEREDVLKFERGSSINENTRVAYVVRGDRAIRKPVELGSASMTDVEVLQGLAAGDQVIISDTRDFADAPELVIAD